MRAIASLIALQWLLVSTPVPAQDVGRQQPNVTDSQGAGIRPIKDALAETWQFIESLDAAVRARRLNATDDLIALSRRFYTDERKAQIEAVVPGWTHMASFDDGKTLWHINLAMVALLQLEEYQRLPPAKKTVLEWIVFLHDIAKEPVNGRDHRHSFRSGAQAGLILPSLGFPVTASYRSDYRDWFDLTDTAVRLDPARNYPVQDNGKLPDIMAGARLIFAEPTLTAVSVITLHQSITSLAAWPVASPLSREQVIAAVTPEMVPALLALTLADSGGWNLFDVPTLAAMYAETRAVFASFPRTGK